MTAKSTATKTNTPAPPTVSAIVSIALPEPERAASRASYYPFDSLEVGQVFGVNDRDKKAMTSAISNANRKWKKQRKDEHGNPVYEMNTINGPDGPVQVPDTTKPVIDTLRHFRARDVTPEIAKTIKGTPLEGAKVLVERDK